jgi:hypothetical protein
LADDDETTAQKPNKERHIERREISPKARSAFLKAAIFKPSLVIGYF